MSGHRWIPLTNASDAGYWCFLWSAPEQTVEQAIVTPVIWDAIAVIMTSLMTMMKVVIGQSLTDYIDGQWVAINFMKNQMILI